MNNSARQHLFDKGIKHENWKKEISSKTEEDFVKLLEEYGFIENKDFVRQYPFEDSYVIDIAFVPEKIAIELDGKGHSWKKIKLNDNNKDKLLLEKDWSVLRFKDIWFKKNPKLFILIVREEVRDRRKTPPSP